MERRGSKGKRQGGSSSRKVAAKSSGAPQAGLTAAGATAAPEAPEGSVAAGKPQEAARRSGDANRRSSAPQSAAALGDSAAARISVSPEQRRAMIAERAYLRAEQRGFSGGDPVADWLEGEREIDELLARKTH